MLAKKRSKYCTGCGLIGIPLEKINDVRQHGWEELFEEVTEFCVVHHINIPNMEEKGRSRGRGG